MMNDPFPSFEFLSQTQFGKLYGVSARQIGIWLSELDLKRFDGQPDDRAVRAGLVKVVSEGDVTFYSWHKTKVVQLFEGAGHRRVGVSANRMRSDFCRSGWPTSPVKCK